MPMLPRRPARDLTVLVLNRPRIALLALVILTCCGLAEAQSDTMPPQLVTLSRSPASVDVTAGAQVVTFTMRITDNLSGVDSSSGSIQANFLSPSGLQSTVGFAPFQPGVILDGVFSMPVRFPRYAEPGTWTIFRLHLSDNAGNSTFLTAAALAAAGFPTTVAVQDATPDTQVPQLSSVTFLPSSVDVSAGPGTFTIELGLSDDVSGIAQNSTGLSDFEI